MALLLELLVEILVKLLLALLLTALGAAIKFKLFPLELFGIELVEEFKDDFEEEFGLSKDLELFKEFWVGRSDMFKWPLAVDEITFISIEKFMQI